MQVLAECDPDVSVEPVDFVRLSFAEQLQLISTTDVLVRARIAQCLRIGFSLLSCVCVCVCVCCRWGCMALASHTQCTCHRGLLCLSCGRRYDGLLSPINLLPQCT